MSSSSDENDSSSPQESSSDSEELCGVVYGQYEPYAHEPLANNRSNKRQRTSSSNDEVDLDGLSPRVLAERFESKVDVKDWCSCGQCKVEHLVGSLEYRCCREVVDTTGKMAFDGSMEHIKCIIQHEDVLAITNKAVLTLAGQSLVRMDRSHYRKKKNVPEDEYLRSVAYRWLIRWLCGYMGWSNTRPLPACIYDYFRTKYQKDKDMKQGISTSTMQTGTCAILY